MTILQDGDPRLKERSPAFDFAAPIRDAYLISSTLERAMVVNRAAGLAAPQTGLQTRVFAIMLGGRPTTCFNPEIIERQGDTAGPEGCLSFPRLFPMVRRSASILVRYFLPSGQERPPLALSGLEARCFQHELDHLDGILLSDRASAQAMANAKARARMRA